MTEPVGTGTTPAELQAFPMPRKCPFHPSEQYARLREEEPVSRVLLPTGRTAWLVTRHDLARQLLADPRVSVDRGHPGYPALVAGLKGVSTQVKGFLTWMDPPEHTEHRRMLVNEFTANRLQALRPKVQEIVDGCVDAMIATGPGADLVPELALAVPSLVICELLGVPYADRDLFQRRSSVLDSRSSTPEEKMTAFRDLRVFIGELVAKKAVEPGEDLLSRLIGKYREAGTYDHELVSGLATLLLTSGFETTANMISLGVLALLEYPEERARLVADPSIASRAVDELLRFFSIAEVSTSRVAAADIELGGVLIKAGEGVIVANGAANRDAAVFPDPDRLDLGREEARHHAAFGYGIHQCLGQNLARLELQVVYTTLFTRLPSLKLAAPFEELRFKNDTNFYGVHEVPVTW
ncbi:cytochrome P450 [Streptomyces sp. NPDC059740]|uniref:cytochrome P450 n=1 Tax=Streptomyces sp. NPDC059740 TaxID=3346926 RepID=UPI00365502DC